MKDVLKIMDTDHEKIAGLFSRLLVELDNDPAQVAALFSQLKISLQKHFQWEEKILLPSFERRAGLAGADTSFILKNEHTQIQKIFIEKIDKMLTENKYQDVKTIIVGLEELLEMHRNLETDIFYPWFDESLNLEEKEEIIKKLIKSRDE